jgi:hypothetical protein
MQDKCCYDSRNQHEKKLFSLVMNVALGILLSIYFYVENGKFLFF